MDHIYKNVIFLVERLHRHFLEVVKAELEHLGSSDINNIQALILFNIGDEELTVGELTNRGYYLGSNVSYNVKKMVENGYLIQERSPHDRRSFHVRAAEKGVGVFRNLSALFDEHASQLGENQFDKAGLEAANATLSRLQQFWSAPQHSGTRLTSAA